jgi:drug/metabolite transporter (DMT)-like permease
LPVTVSSILWLTIAPLTAVFAWLIFGERMTPIEVAGGALVLTGVWIVGREEKAEGIGEAGAAEVIPPVAQV